MYWSPGEIYKLRSSVVYRVKKISSKRARTNFNLYESIIYNLLLKSKYFSSCRTGEFTLRVADPQLLSQPETIQVQAVSMQVTYNETDTFSALFYLSW